MPKIHPKTPKTPRLAQAPVPEQIQDKEPLFHWGIPKEEITDNEINAIYKDIELSINNVNQVINKEWEKIKVSVDSAAVDTVAPPTYR